MKKQKLNNLITLGGTSVLCVVMAVLYSAGALDGNHMLKGMLVLIGIHIIWALSLNLTVGILGELSLGHAGFMCVGAIFGGTVSQIIRANAAECPSGIRLLITLVVSGIMAAVFGLLIGIPVMRLRGDYLAIVTLGFGEIMKSIANNIYLTLDANGLHFGFTKPPENVDEATAKQILKGSIGMQTPQDTNIWWVAAILIITLFVMMTFINSRSGRACMAVRDNYIAAQSVGINVTKYRLMAFTISAGIAGIGGALYAHSVPMITFGKFDYNFSILILVFVVLGGLGSMRGSVIATIILYALPEMLRKVNENIVNARMLIYAVILILLMLWKNAPFFINLREKIKARFKKSDTAGSGGAEA